jgi:uncharacterized protein
MRGTIGRLFGRSPFVPLQAHMEKVAACVEMVPTVLDAFQRGDAGQVEAIAAEISKLEHQADLVKNDIRNNLPKGLFMPVDRANILEILSIQDTLADRAENIGVLLTLKQARQPDELKEKLKSFLDKNMEAFNQARRVIGELDELLETGFGGAEAERVKRLVEKVALTEHEADLIQRDLLKALYVHEEELSHGDFNLWMRLVRELASLSNQSERLANRVRMTLEPK